MFLILLLALQVGIEYGKPIEMKGLTKVFVDTGVDMKNRERIIEELEKSKLPITILERPDDAEIVLQFRAGKKTESYGTVTQQIPGTNIYGSRTRQEEIQTGEGIVFLPKGNSIRILMSFEGSKDNTYEAKPCTNFARKFIKAYKSIGP